MAMPRPRVMQMPRVDKQMAAPSVMALKRVMVVVRPLESKMSMPMVMNTVMVMVMTMRMLTGFSMEKLMVRMTPHGNHTPHYIIPPNVDHSQLLMGHQLHFCVICFHLIITDQNHNIGYVNLDIHVNRDIRAHLHLPVHVLLDHRFNAATTLVCGPLNNGLFPPRLSPTPASALCVMRTSLRSLCRALQGCRAVALLLARRVRYTQVAW